MPSTKTVSRTCAICEKEFQVPHRSKRKTCSDAHARQLAWSNRDRETHRKRVSESIRKLHAETRALGYPDKRRCARCTKYKPISEFYWQKVTLTNGEIAYRAYSYCKMCQRERSAAYKKRMKATLSPEEIREKNRIQARRYRQKKREGQMPVRLPKEPFLDFVLTKKRSMAGVFVGRDGSYDTKAFATWLGLSNEKYQSLERLARASSDTRTVQLDLVDHVLSAIGETHRLYELYPELST